MSRLPYCSSHIGSVFEVPSLDDVILPFLSEPSIETQQLEGNVFGGVPVVLPPLGNILVWEWRMFLRMGRS